MAFESKFGPYRHEGEKNKMFEMTEIGVEFIYYRLIDDSPDDKYTENSK